MNRREFLAAATPLVLAPSLGVPRQSAARPPLMMSDLLAIGVRPKFFMYTFDHEFFDRQDISIDPDRKAWSDAVGAALAMTGWLFYNGSVFCARMSVRHPRDLKPGEWAAWEQDRVIWIPRICGSPRAKEPTTGFDRRWSEDCVRGFNSVGNYTVAYPYRLARFTPVPPGITVPFLGR